MTRIKTSIAVSSAIATTTAIIGCSGNFQPAKATNAKADSHYINNYTSTQVTAYRGQQKVPAIQSHKLKPLNVKQTTYRHTPRIGYKAAQQNQGREDTWAQINNGYKLANYNHQPKVKRLIKSFSKHPNHLMTMAYRANPYLPYIMDEINKRGMPSEMALLPFVESAFKAHAYSHAHAAGLWQFIPSTGKRYGLKQTASYDARYDPFKATHAALDYLEDLSKEFDGDYLLALASYNCGEKRVHRERAKNKAKGLPTDFWHLNLPKETRQYVPRLLAYKEIYKQPARYNIQLPTRISRSELVRTKINKAVDLRQVAQQLGLPRDTLTSINRAYKIGITTPQTAKEINLPRQYANKMLKIMYGMPVISETEIKQAHRKNIVLASTKKRSKKRSYKINKRSSKKSRRAYRLAKKRATKKSKRYKAKKRRTRVVTHRVRSGDTLGKIAKRYGTSVHRIMRLNRMKSSRIKSGARLKIATKRYNKKRRYG